MAGGLLALSSPSPALAQAVIPIGGGSYASTIPAAENVTTDTRPTYVLPGSTAPIPTNDWWTPLILRNMYGADKYHLWAQPLDFTVEAYGLGVHYPPAWAGAPNSNQGMSSPDPVQVGGVGFAPTSEKVKSWGDWTVAFRLEESATEYVDVTIGHGLPLTWLEYTGVTSAQLATDATTTYFAAMGAPQAFPFTGSQYGFTWRARSYGVFAPTGTSFSLANGVVIAAFSGAARYLVVAALPNPADLTTFAQYAYAVPRNSTVAWAYDEERGELRTTWAVTTQPLQGTNTDVIQGFLPHQLKYTTFNFTPTNLSYLSARGTVRCATGNNFQITYPFNGTLTNLPAPEVLPNRPTPYDAARLQTLITDFARTNVYLGGSNTYGGGKSLALFTQFMANADVARSGSFTSLKTKLQAALANWFTYTPGEIDTYYAYLPNFKALMGFDPGFGSEEFNDHHFHYGYFAYAAGVLGIYDPAFAARYGEMAKLVTKEYANWDRTDRRFPFFRTFDIWEGHSWANGGYGMNPPIGNNQESSSEAMMSWVGMIQLGLATGDQQMTSAGVFGYVSEAAATNEYWFDRDDQNFPAAYGPAGKVGGIVSGAAIEYQTFFGSQPFYIHNIQHLPVLPSSYYLVQHDKFAAAQTEFDYLRGRAIAGGFGDVGSWGGIWTNVSLQYASLFNPEYAVANQDSALRASVDLAGLTYYTTHSNRALGHRAFDHYIGATNSGVFFNAALNQYTYCAFNPTTTSQTYNVYRNAAVIGTITVAANSFFSTHTLGGGPNQAPAVSLTAPGAGATYTAPATITLTATAADVNGTISKVDFYDGPTLLATSTTSPYTYTWTGATTGIHQLTAEATDNGGAVGSSAPVAITVSGGLCTDTVANGDYSYEVSTTAGVVSWKFIPLEPIVGSTLAILYVKVGAGGVAGYGMMASGSDFVLTQPHQVGQELTFYFTYRVGATGGERNSSATPHHYTVGDACGPPVLALPAPGVARPVLRLYPNPAQQVVVVEAPAATDIHLLNAIGREVLRCAVPSATGRTVLDVAALPKGVYLLTVRSATGHAVRRFVKE
ncbi:MAG: T9SS type A sorting domain-containing protein [Hymenobacteraceae bacterium]|nr:T9SS type A sorting domain-containing protein [Hymenobacteraceae bacterium]